MVASSAPGPSGQGMDVEIPLSLLIDPAITSAYQRQTGRPFVTLSYTQSLDGSIADRPGRPLALSGPPSQVLTHRLRAAHEAILVGIGTVLADNPRLDVRLVEGRSPQPVILDSRLRFPLDANLLQISSPCIAATDQADPQRELALKAAGARVLRLPAEADGRVSLIMLLNRLGALGINSLMVEGGAQVITSFLAARLVDRLVLTIAPVIVGGLHAVQGQGHSEPQRAFAFAQGGPASLSFPRLVQVQHVQLGEDLIVWGDLA